MEASRDRLMAIIKTQSEIAASDLDIEPGDAPGCQASAGDHRRHLRRDRAAGGRRDGLRRDLRGGHPVPRHPHGPAQHPVGTRPGPRPGPLLRGHRDRSARRSQGLEEGEPALDDLRAAQAPRAERRRAQGLFATAPPLRARRRRDAQPAERGDLGPSRPRLPLRGGGKGGQDGRPHRPLQPSGLRGAAGGRGRAERPLRPPARTLHLRPGRLQGRQRPLRAPRRRRGAQGRRRR